MPERYKCSGIVAQNENQPRRAAEVRFIMAERIILESLLNTRDLGGYRTVDGMAVRPKALIRSGALAGITKKDEEILFAEYGVRTVIDLRTRLEADEKPDPEVDGVTNLFHPILDEELAGFTHENEDGEEFDMLEGFLMHAKSLEGKPEIYIGQLYKNLVLSERAMNRYGRFIDLVLEAGDGAVLWHCSAGKDRAGMASALLLTALGVDRQTVLEDFVKSNEYLRPETERMMALVRTRTQDQVLEKCAETLCQVHESYLENAFGLIDQTFGGMETYLKEQLGVGEEKRKRLREKFLV